MEAPAAIRALFDEYSARLSRKDLSALAALHWQDEGYAHGWAGRIDRGWKAYERRLEQELQEMVEPTFLLHELTAAVFDGRFAAATARWSCEFGKEEGPRIRREGVVMFALALRGGSWRIVADHYAAASAQ